MTLLYSIQTEWLKKKGSLASWLVVIGAFFTPSVLTLIQIMKPEKLPAKFQTPDFWEAFFKNSWQTMNVMLLPMGIILAISLITQLEYKNNAWKQLHATPQSLTAIFFAKFTVILLMQLQLFLLFTVGIYLSALIPSLVLADVQYPAQPFPYMYFLRESALYFIDVLPIVAIQYLLALQFRNFLIPVGAGLILMVTGIIMISWKYAYVYPYNYSMLYFINRFPDLNIHALALGWFGGIMTVGYALYVTKKDKG